jgi:hypothetical protein
LKTKAWTLSAPSKGKLCDHIEKEDAEKVSAGLDNLGQHEEATSVRREAGLPIIATLLLDGDPVICCIPASGLESFEYSGDLVAVWMEIAENARRTGGTVFVVHRTDGKGAYGCAGQGPGSLDGQAQEGEVKVATTLGCSIEWVGYSESELGVVSGVE